jgi:hypothetical protein
LTFSYSYHHLLTIRIRIVILSVPLASLAPPANMSVRSITQHEHGVKEANEVSGDDIF